MTLFMMDFDRRSANSARAHRILLITPAPQRPGTEVASSHLVADLPPRIREGGLAAAADAFPSSTRK